MADGGKTSMARHPARFVVVVFLVAIAVGTALLLLPWSTADGRSTDGVTALFTATSAVCVIGLTVVDTGSHWSGFGQVVILVLIQLGGLGFMTMASLIAMLVSRRVGLRLALITTRERSTLSLGELRRVLAGVGVVTLLVESSLAVVLTWRFRTTYGEPWGTAAWQGTFHAVSSFNNAGFSLFATSLERFETDPFVLVPVALAVIVGGLGFPVLVELYERRRARRWATLTLHAKVTLVATALLLVVGFVAFAAAEWHNPDTLGPLDGPDKAMGAGFASVTPRTAGFHAIDPAAMTDEGILATMALMFVGAGSAGTSGGIKVGTAAVVALVAWSQLRGRTDVVAFGRRLGSKVQREATTVVLLALVVVTTTTVVLLAATSSATLEQTAFEAVSAFGTAGLSLGITPTLPDPGRLALVLTMLIGRLGPVTLGMALVLKRRDARVRHPEEAPLIG